MYTRHCDLPYPRPLPLRPDFRSTTPPRPLSYLRSFGDPPLGWNLPTPPLHRLLRGRATYRDCGCGCGCSKLGTLCVCVHCGCGEHRSRTACGYLRVRGSPHAGCGCHRNAALSASSTAGSAASATSTKLAPPSAPLTATHCPRITPVSWSLKSHTRISRRMLRPSGCGMCGGTGACARHQASRLKPQVPSSC